MPVLRALGPVCLCSGPGSASFQLHDLDQNLNSSLTQRLQVESSDNNSACLTVLALFIF